MFDHELIMGVKLRAPGAVPTAAAGSLDQHRDT